MKKQQKDRIIKRAIKFIKENTNDNAQRGGAAIIKELRLVKNLTIPVVSKSVAKKYAEFCVECDRKGLPLLLIDDYIEQYCC